MLYMHVVVVLMRNVLSSLTLGLELVVLLREDVEPFRGGAFLEQVPHWEWTLGVYSLVPFRFQCLPLPAFLPTLHFASSLSLKVWHSQLPTPAACCPATPARVDPPPQEP